MVELKEERDASFVQMRRRFNRAMVELKIGMNFDDVRFRLL
jgi:hypothetical protein